MIGRASLVLVGVLLLACVRPPPPPTTERWILDGTATIHGLRPQVLGAPAAAPAPGGAALCFDGDDGIVLPANPLEGLATFTLEALVRVDDVPPSAAAAPDEPRFLHIESTDGARATMEARVAGGSWYLDTFLRAGERRRVLVDAARAHPTGRWTWVALGYDGTAMHHFVGGVEEAAAPLSIPAFGPGKVSLGVRQNLVHWFRGCIRELRVIGRALPTAELQR